MCWKCGSLQAFNGPLGRSAQCETCGADLRSCKNCVHYSPGSYHDCAERVEDAVRDKERSNFCDYFRFKPSVPGTGKGSSSGDEGRSSRSAFDTLFES